MCFTEANIVNPYGEYLHACSQFIYSHVQLSPGLSTITIVRLVNGTIQYLALSNVFVLFLAVVKVSLFSIITHEATSTKAGESISMIPQ